MSGTTTPVPAGDAIRDAIANEYDTIPAPYNATSDGSQGSVSGTVTPGTYLTIDTVGSASVASDLFLGSGYSIIENVNDINPIVDADTATGAGADLVYIGDAAGQTFFAASDNVYADFTGYGNIFAGSTTPGGNYVVAGGLASAGTDSLTLAAAPLAGGVDSGNTVAAGAGNASIAAGLGNNAIFLGSGTALVASEGHDTVIGGSGADTINGLGAATVFAGAGSTTFYGNGGTGEIIGGTVSGSGALNVYGGTGSVTVFGGTGDEAAFGGSAGNNVLVSGAAGNATLVGGGYNDLLVATGTGTSTLVAGSGAETLFGGGASGTTNFFLGDGADTVVAGTGNEYIQFGAGTSTVFGSTGHDVYGAVDSIPGSTDLVLGFNAAQDFINLQGFSASDTGVSDLTTNNGSDYLSLSNGDVIEFYGVTDLTSANFVLSPSGAAFAPATHHV